MSARTSICSVYEARQNRKLYSQMSHEELIKYEWLLGGHTWIYYGMQPNNSFRQNKEKQKILVWYLLSLSHSLAIKRIAAILAIYCLIIVITIIIRWARMS